MKKINLVLFSLLMLCTITSAQITITSSSLPQVGDSFTTVAVIPDNEISIGSPGENQTYNFSFLQGIDSETTILMDTADAVGSEHFPNANMAVSDGLEFSIFYQITSDAAYNLGFYGDLLGDGNLLPLKYEPPQLLFKTPFTYNTSYSNDWGFYITLAAPEEEDYDSIRVSTSSTQTVFCDGYGEVLTPNGSFDGLRALHTDTIYQLLEIFTNGFWIPVNEVNDVRTTYNWYSLESGAFDLVSISIENDTVASVSYMEIPQPPQAEFSWQVGSLFVYNFTDESNNNPTSWAWDFGDGSTSSQQNPAHSFPASGDYEVCLTATNDLGQSSVCHTVSVVLPPEAAFSFEIDNGVVNFTDASTNIPTAWAWNFGDGNTSNDQNPTHTFMEDEDYEVCLTASNSSGEDETCQTLSIVIVGTDDIFEKIEMELFPNPIDKFLQIELNTDFAERLHIEIVNPQGQILIRQDLKSASRHIVNTESLAAGVYYLLLRDDKGLLRNRLSVVKK